MTRNARSRPVRRPRRQLPEVWMYVKDPVRLRIRRKAKGLTQGQVAVFGRCTQQYISKLESGTDRDCSEDIALRISKALDVDVEDYFEAREVVRMSEQTTTSRVGSSAVG